MEGQLYFHTTVINCSAWPAQTNHTQIITMLVYVSPEAEYSVVSQ